MKTDPQLKSNDCGISAVKTIFKIYGKDIDRKYIENQIPLEEKGSRLSDLKNFIDNHGFASQYKLLDINYIQENKQSLKELFPFILPVENKDGLHYVVVYELKGEKLKIFDPSKGNQYFLSLQELKKKSPPAGASVTLMPIVIAPAPITFSSANTNNIITQANRSKLCKNRLCLPCRWHKSKENLRSGRN